MKFKLFSVYLVLSLLCVACFNAPDYPETPEIAIKEIRKSRAETMSGDSVIVVLEFKDGNGDLGKRNPGDTIPNLFITDKRFSIIDSFSYSIPNIPKNGSVDDISGVIELNLVAKIYCNPLFPDKTRDTLEFEIQVRDQSFKFSNKVTTGSIAILCQ